MQVGSPPTLAAMSWQTAQQEERAPVMNNEAAQRWFDRRHIAIDLSSGDPITAFRSWLNELKDRPIGPTAWFEVQVTPRWPSNKSAAVEHSQLLYRSGSCRTAAVWDGRELAVYDTAADIDPGHVVDLSVELSIASRSEGVVDRKLVTDSDSPLSSWHGGRGPLVGVLIGTDLFLSLYEHRRAAEFVADQDEKEESDQGPEFPNADSEGLLHMFDDRWRA